MYKPQGAVVIEVVDDYPVFGQIETIYVVDNIIMLYLDIFTTCSFHKHCYAYIVKRANQRKTLSIENLLVPGVLHICRLTVDGSPNLCVVPKFHIAGTLQK